MVFEFAEAGTRKEPVNSGNGGLWQRITQDNEYGATVAAIGSIDNDLDEELIVSNPGQFRGGVRSWFGMEVTFRTLISMDRTGSNRFRCTSRTVTVGEMTALAMQFPSLLPDPPEEVTYCDVHVLSPNPFNSEIVGELAGDRLGQGGGGGRF